MPYPGHGADVVFMAMRDDDCLDLRPPAMQEACVWQDLLHAQVCEAAKATQASPSVLNGYPGVLLDSVCSMPGLLSAAAAEMGTSAAATKTSILYCLIFSTGGKRLLGEHQPSIDKNVAILHSDQHAIHANLAKSTNGKNSQGRALIWWGARECPACHHTLICTPLAAPSIRSVACAGQCSVLMGDLGCENWDSLSMCDSKK